MGNVVSALSILFVLYAFFKIDFSQILILDGRRFAGICILGLLLKMATVFLMGYAWLLWLECFSGRTCSRKEAIRIYTKANIGKYVPGNMMHYVERNLFAKNLGLPQGQIAAASFIEVLSLLISAFAFGFFFAFTQVEDTIHLLGMLLPAKTIGWLAGAGVFCACMMLYFGVHSFFQKKYGAIAGFWGTFLRCFWIYAAVLLLLGLILLLLFVCVQGDMPDVSASLQIISAYIIAWVAGFVAPGAPGGIGVRELVLTMLLSPIMGQDLIVQLSVLHRAITIVGDFIVYFLGKI